MLDKTGLFLVLKSIVFRFLKAGTVWCRSNFSAVKFLLNIHKRHPIPRPLGMGCLLWIESLTDILPQFLQWCVQYHVTLDRVITAINCIDNALGRLYALQGLMTPSSEVSLVPSTMSVCLSVSVSPSSKKYYVRSVSYTSGWIVSIFGTNDHKYKTMCSMYLLLALLSLYFKDNSAMHFAI